MSMDTYEVDPGNKQNILVRYILFIKRILFWKYLHFFLRKKNWNRTPFTVQIEKKRQVLHCNAGTSSSR